MVCVIYMLTIIIIITINEVLTNVKLSLKALPEKYRRLKVSII